MTAYAIVSDIHGNIEAVKSVWSKIGELGLADHLVLNAGDTVAYGDDSAACIDFVRANTQIVSVGGNYDYNVAIFPTDQERFERKWKSRRSEKYEALLLASSQITEDQRNWLLDLPPQLDLVIENHPVSLSHYSPVGSKMSLGTWTTDRQLQDVDETVNYDVVIVGHTHTPFVRQMGKTLFINPGSVGKSWGRSTFAVLTIEDNKLTGEVLT
jgi:putative phosphoesterase